MTNDEGMTKPERALDYEARFWADGEAAVVREEPSDKPIYDLEERTAQFGEAVIDFAKSLPRNPVTSRIDAVSKKEFLKNIGTCRKEARETKHFLRMAVRAAPELKPQARIPWQEARELHLIFSKIWRNGR